MKNANFGAPLQALAALVLAASAFGQCPPPTVDIEGTAGYLPAVEGPGTYAITLVAPESFTTTCPWSVSSSTPWITIQTPNSGTYSSGTNVTIPFSFSTNTGSPRAGAIQFAIGSSNYFWPFYQNSTNCVVSVSPTAVSFGPSGGTLVFSSSAGASVLVTPSPADCWWGASAYGLSEDWVTYTGTVNVPPLPPSITLSYAISPNPGTPRSTTLIVDVGSSAFPSITITQDGSLPSLSSVACSLLAGTVGTAFLGDCQATGGMAPFTWSVTNGALPSGLSLNSSTGVISGTPTTPGSFPVTISVSDSSVPAETTQQPVTVAIAPAACTFSISPTGLSFASSGGGGSISVTAGSACSWMASSALSWVTLGSSSGTGNGSVSIEVATDTGASRSGTLTIAGLSFSVQQAAATTTQPQCLNFPSGFIPFSSIYYVTAADTAGDHLVVGVPAPGAPGLISANIPPPAFTNQTFCGQVQLASQQLYPNVYVPTPAELGGNFSEFSGSLVNPTTNLPYAGGVIPASQLDSVFAWRIGPAQPASSNSNWRLTGALTEQMNGQASVLLPGGEVLVVSGGDPSVDLYNPATGVFALIGQTIFVHGNGVTTTLLNDGRVLIVGGSTTLTAAEIYDPVAGQFTALSPTIQPHGLTHTATLLNDGRVLIVGGFADPLSNDALNSPAEIFNPSTNTFAPASPMSLNRSNHTANLLLDGRVLIAGGTTGNGTVNPPTTASAELYDPSTGAFSPTSTSMSNATGGHFAALLPSGKVLLGGGLGGLFADLFDPSSDGFTPTGSPSMSHNTGNATLLTDGEVLVAGGDQPSPGLGFAELYNPATGSFTTTGSMTTSRTREATTQLQDGRVLVTGGDPVCCGQALSSAEIYTPTVEGLITSQAGLTFPFAQGNSTTPSSQTIEVLSNTTTIPWTVSIHTYEGGNWLTATPSSGNSVPGATLTNLVVTTNPSGLAAQDYYGSVTLTPSDGIHPAVSIAIVLHIVPAGTAAPPIVLPTGLLFFAAPNATLNAQTFNITNLTSSAITVSGIGTTTPKFFSFSPPSATIPAASTATFTVAPNLTGLTAGVYNGTITLTFGDGSMQAVSLLLIVSPTITNHARETTTATPTCAPSTLLPVFTTLGTGFAAPAAWPITVTVGVVDNCGDPITSGNVIVSFTNGDPPIKLLSTGSGNWTGTWTPATTSSGVSVRADAQSSSLAGSASVSGAVSSNPAVPVVSPGGVVSSIDFSSTPSLGLLVSIFGSELAVSPLSAPVPLPTQLGSTQVVLGGEALPLLYVSSNLVNVLIPYDLAVNVGDQLVVQNGPAVSVPVSTAIFNATPAIFRKRQRVGTG